jgi:hypothetical protein
MPDRVIRVGVFEETQLPGRLAYKITPSAGSDYPALGFIGQERTYVHVPGEFTRDAWKRAMRGGNAYVSNAPILELTVNGKGMGEQVQVKPGGAVSIHAEAAINPDIDLLDRLELIIHGGTVKVINSEEGAETLTLDVAANPHWGVWIAVRAYGTQREPARTVP